MNASVRDTSSPVNQNAAKFWPAFLLALFLGLFGAHRFCLKSPNRVLMLCTLGGLGVWALVDLLTILLGRFSDETGEPIPNATPLVSWGIFVVFVLVGLANNDENPRQVATSQKSALRDSGNDAAESARQPYCGVYLCTTGQFRGALALYSGGSCEIKFGNGGSRHTGFWSVEGRRIRIQVQDTGDTIVNIDSPRHLSIHDGGVHAEYDRI